MRQTDYSGSSRAALSDPAIVQCAIAVALLQIKPA